MVIKIVTLHKIGSEDSSEDVEVKAKQRLNSTLLDDGLAKNLDEVMGLVDISPILNEGICFMAISPFIIT